MDAKLVECMYLQSAGTGEVRVKAGCCLGIEDIVLVCSIRLSASASIQSLDMLDLTPLGGGISQVYHLEQS